MEELNKFLIEVVNNCAKCQCCTFCRAIDDKTNICFFAYECIRKNFKLYQDGVKENEN